MLSSREYRCAAAFEPTGEGYAVRGYATTFDDPYDMGGGLMEVIDPAAFDGCDMSDVIFQMNHEGMVLARQRNGTLRLEVDGHGLAVEADLGGSECGRQLHEAIKNGLMDKMSWGFTVAEGGWDYDRGTRTSTIRKVEKVYDVSAVSIPANPGTDISARSAIYGGLGERERAAEAADARARAAIAARLAMG